MKAQGPQRHKTRNALVVIGSLGNLIAAAVDLGRDEGCVIISRGNVVWRGIAWYGPANNPDQIAARRLTREPMDRSGAKRVTLASSLNRSAN